MTSDRVLRADLANVTSEDGWASWRQRESELLSDLMRRRIHHLQNPPDCTTARKLVCNLNKVIPLALRRTLSVPKLGCQ